METVGMLFWLSSQVTLWLSVLVFAIIKEEERLPLFSHHLRAADEWLLLASNKELEEIEKERWSRADPTWIEFKT